MKRGWQLAPLVLLLAAAASGQSAPPPQEPASAQALLDAQPKERIEDLLEEGMVLLPSDGLPKGQVEALVIFVQPQETAWKLLLDRARQKEYRPELTSVAVVQNGADFVVEEQHLKIAFLKVAYRLRNRIDPGLHTIRWELDPDFESTLEQVSGYWELHTLDERRTLARFGTKVSVSSAVPGFLQNGITRKNVPETLENTRRWVDSGGSWRP